MPSVSSPPLLTPMPFQPSAASPRVLFLASTQSQGGIERHSVELAAALKMRGVPLQFACPPGSYLEGWCRERGLLTLPFQVRNSGDLNAALHLAKLIRAERVDIVHSHSRRDYVIAALGVGLARLFFRRHAHLILHAHMVRPLGDPPRLSGRFFERSVDAVVAVSGTVGDRLRHDHDFHPAFVHLIHNGVHLEDFAKIGSQEALTQRSQARQEWGIPDTAPVLGMIGRLDTKGQAWLLEIAPALVRRHPTLHLVFIGSEGKPGEQARLTAQANDAGLRERLHFAGSREDIPTLLPALDIFVHLPHDESFGLALAEAMAAGLPTVAAAIGGCREVVRDGVSGRLVALGDTSALTDALMWLLDTQVGAVRRRTFGEAGREIVAKNFSRTRQLNLLQALYQELCPTPSILQDSPL